MKLDYGCRDSGRPVDHGLFYCIAHRSYGYRGEPCHENRHGSIVAGWPRRCAVHDRTGKYVYVGSR